MPDRATNPSPPRRTADWPHALAIFCVLLALYLYTAPRTVVLEDDGLFILSSWFLGIEHPPGYPVYVLLGKLATLLPFGSPAWRVHALSALFAALACVFVYRIARQLLPGQQAPAWFAALGLGVSATFWSQALIADVYSLHALIFFALFDLALRQWRTGPTDQASARRALLSALLLGLGLANHWPLLVLSGPALALLWLPSWRVLLRWSPLLLLALALGLAPYAWMVWRSWQEPVISFQGPLTDWHTLRDFLLRRGYQGIDTSLSAGSSDRLLYGAELLRLAGKQLLLPGALLGLLGALGQWRRLEAPIAAALTLAFLGPTLLLVALLQFDFQTFQREAFEVYPVVAWGVLALWATLGLLVLTEALAPRLSPRWTDPGPLGVPALTLLIGGSALLLLPLAVHWGAKDRHLDRLAHRYAQALLATPSADAVLLLHGDMAIPATAYLRLILEERPDLKLVSEPGLILEPRLFPPILTPKHQQRALVDAFIARKARAVWRLHNDDDRTGIITWLLFRVDPASAPGDARRHPEALRFALPPAQRDLLVWLAQSPKFADGWDEMLRRGLLADFIRFQTQAELHAQWAGDDPAVEALRADILAQLPEAALMRAVGLFASDPAAHADEIGQLVDRFAAHSDDPALSKTHLGAFYFLLTHIALRTGNLDAARAAVAASLEYWPAPPNPAGSLNDWLKAQGGG